MTYRFSAPELARRIPAPVREVHDRLCAAGERSLIAGGAVRDLLCGRTPKDFDIASSARPERVAELFERTVLVGAQFGVSRVLIAEGAAADAAAKDAEEVDRFTEVEVAAFRADLEYLDGRHPVGVRFSSEREDARRRDFTINGLFYDLEMECVVDYVGGCADLAARRLRAIGVAAERFQEDRLRLLRAVRFATVLGFAIEEQTWEALLSAAPGILAVSGERIRDELEKILLHPRRELGFFLLSDSGLMGEILPEVEAMRGVEQPPEYHPEGDVHRHTALVLSELREPNFPLALGALLHDVGKPPTFEIADRIRFNKHDIVGSDMAAEICHRLRLSGRERDLVVMLVRRHMIFVAITEMREAKRQRLFEEPYFEALLELCRADCLGSHRDTGRHDEARDLYRSYRAAGPPPQPLLRGRDLIELGYVAGPTMGGILRQLDDAQREGEVADRSAALAWLAAQHPLGTAADDERGTP